MERKREKFEKWIITGHEFYCYVLLLNDVDLCGLLGGYVLRENSQMLKILMILK